MIGGTLGILIIVALALWVLWHAVDDYINRRW